MFAVYNTKIGKLKISQKNTKAHKPQGLWKYWSLSNQEAESEMRDNSKRRCFLRRLKTGGRL